MFKLQEVHQQSQEVEEKLKIVEQQLSELEQFSVNLKDLEKNKSKEILASLGKGVYLKSEIKEDKLFVEAGAGILVKKTPAETNEIIEDQIARLNEMKTQLVAENDSIQEKMGNLIEKAK